MSPTTTSTSRRRILMPTLTFGFFIFLVVLFSIQNYFFNRNISFFRWVLWNSARWFPWAILTPFIVRFGRRFSFSRPKGIRVLPNHLLACLGFSAIAILITYGLNMLSAASIRAPLSFPVMAGELIHFSILTYWGVLGVGAVFEYYRKYREQELAASQLETRLAQAHLQVLRMQIHPHFLFNTLHAISALIHSDPDAADLMINRLSGLLRMTLEQSAFQEVPLKEELEILGQYLEIMKVRFGDRLEIRQAIPPDTLEALVPNFILQPLVENAIRHGVSPSEEGGKVEILAARNQERLRLEIQDNGQGFSDSQETLLQKGQSLANAAERLRRLYGPEQKFLLRNGEAGGAWVILEIPFHKT